MGIERWVEILAFAGHVVSVLLIAWGVVTRKLVLVLTGLAQSVIVIAVRTAILGNWWAGELVTLLALVAVGAAVVVVTRR